MTDKRRPGQSRIGKGGEVGKTRVPRSWLLFGALAMVAALLGAFLYLRSGTAGGAAVSVLRTGDFHALAFHPTNADVLFFGHHNGILRSDDGGRNWRPAVEKSNLDAMGMAIGRGEPPRVYVAGHDVFQVSLDGGAAWQPVAHNLPGTDLHGFAMSPDQPDHLAALVVGQGLFTSADAGRTWQRPGGQLPGDVMGLASAGGEPETFYAASTQRGVFRSTDGGRSWTNVGAPAALAVAVDPLDRRTVYAGSVDGVYKSTDGGANWRKLDLPTGNVVALAASPARANLVALIAVRNREGLVYRSEDGGQTW